MDFKVNDKVKLSGDKPRPPRMIGHRQRITRAGNPIVDAITLRRAGKGGAVQYGTTYVVSEKTDGVDNSAEPTPRINLSLINSNGELFEVVEAANKPQTENTNE